MRWANQQAVVTLPHHIDVSNAGHVREELLSVINRGARVLIADMTATISCDNAGADAVLRASQRAAISGTELRLVVTARVVSQVLNLSGLDRLVSIYPSLEAATAASGAPAAVPALIPAGGLRLDLADQARAAVTAEQGHCDRELFDTVLTSLSHTALNLQAAMDLPADAARQHVAIALEYLDGTVREIRDTAFTARGHHTTPRISPRDETG